MAHSRRAENFENRSQGFDRGRGHSNHQSARPRYSPPFEGELGGHLFLTNTEQIEENFARQIFGESSDAFVEFAFGRLSPCGDLCSVSQGQQEVLLDASCNHR